MYRFITIQFNVNELSVFQLLYNTDSIHPINHDFLHVFTKKINKQQKEQQHCIKLLNSIQCLMDFLFVD